MSNLSVTVIDSPAKLQGLALSWNELLEASVSDSPFLRWEWLATWVECCLGKKRSLFVLSFEEKGRVAGIAPFFLEMSGGVLPRRTIRFLGTPEGGSDYLDVFCRRGRETEVADALYHYLVGEGRGRWDVLHLQDIPAESVFLLRFLNRVDEVGKYYEITPGAFCPVLDLASDREGWPLAATPGCKKKFHKELAILEREGAVSHRVEEEADAASLERFFAFYRQATGRTSEVLHRLLAGYLERCEKGGGVSIDALAVGGRDIASLLHFRCHGSLFLYLVAVDKDFNPRISVGHLLLGHCIVSAREAGYRRCDFLKGDEGYKFFWATGGRRTLQLRLWRKSPLALSAGCWRMARHAGKLLLR
ncbi:GNAT family N-acetyltransferase [Geomonas agri]|uniref:GNAT family N-acetyltransferase n=1 Tax=Geomonas agri TaxID=2873702 RepID=UPI001CD446DE|nr:GNAT family N-acetyltransferase [Geomonas agri]